jgi:hypothetical protein
MTVKGSISAGFYPRLPASALAPKGDIPVDEITDLMTVRQDTGEASHTNRLEGYGALIRVGKITLVQSKLLFSLRSGSKTGAPFGRLNTTSYSPPCARLGHHDHSVFVVRCGGQRKRNWRR